MKYWFKIYLKLAWLASISTVLLMGTNLCVTTDKPCFQAGETMYFLMFWLSFPTGILFLFGSMIFLQNETIHFPSEFIIAWFIMACGGFVQWFLLLPAIFAKKEFTILNLGKQAVLPASNAGYLRTKTDGETIELPSAESLSLKSKNAPSSIVRTAATRAPKHHRKLTNRIPAFDRKGRTPLERAISHRL